jgi:diacylglycerol kinase, putative (fragment)
LSFTAYKYRQIGPIYYEYGSLIITYDNADIAVKAFYMLREYTYDEKNLLVLLLPNVMAHMIPESFKVSHRLSSLALMVLAFF